MKRFGWHIINGDMKLRYKDGRRVKIGEKVRWKSSYRGEDIYICYAGMHACPTAKDAFKAWIGLGKTNPRVGSKARKNGWIMCRVEIDGTKDGPRYNSAKDYYNDNGHDKFVGTHRKIVGTIKQKNFNKIRVKHGFNMGFMFEEDVLKFMEANNRKSGRKLKVK